jgi:hypothetical protein
MKLFSFQAGPAGAPTFIKRGKISEHLKKGPKSVLIVYAEKHTTRSISVRFPEDLYEEIRKVSGGRISAWLREVAAKAIEEEKRKALLRSLPEEIRARLLEKAGGNEQEAASLALHYLSLAIEEEEEEETVQEAIGYANKMEALKKRKGRERSTG